MKNILIIFGHHKTKDSFNASIRDTFIEEAKCLGHKIDLINLFEEKEQLPFYNSNFASNQSVYCSKSTTSTQIGINPWFTPQISLH